MNHWNIPHWQIYPTYPMPWYNQSYCPCCGRSWRYEYNTWSSATTQAKWNTPQNREFLKNMGLTDEQIEALDQKKNEQIREKTDTD